MTSNTIQVATTPPEKKQYLLELQSKFAGNTCRDQRQRLITAFKRDSVTTYEAMRLLDIYSPPARIKELRGQGNHIQTLWVNETTESGQQHRIGMCVLISEAPQKERATAAKQSSSKSKPSMENCGGQTHE